MAGPRDKILASKIKTIRKNNIEFELLPYQFFLFAAYGIWFPKSWTKQQQLIYKLYFVLFISLCFLGLTEMFIYIFLNYNNLKMTDLFFIEMTSIALYKAITVNRKRQNFMSLISNFCDFRWINHQDPKERLIYETASVMIR